MMINMPQVSSAFPSLIEDRSFSPEDSDDANTGFGTPLRQCAQQHQINQVPETTPPVEEERLPDDYEPAPSTVVIKQGKRTPNHPGNQQLRAIVLQYAPEYSRTTTKKERSEVVTKIINTHFNQGGGPFVCWKKQESVWYTASDMQRREKVGGLLRDNLHNQYKSSAKFKHVKRKEREAKQKLLLQKYREKANEEQLQALQDPDHRKKLVDFLMEQANFAEKQKRVHENRFASPADATDNWGGDNNQVFNFIRDTSGVNGNNGDHHNLIKQYLDGPSTRGKIFSLSATQSMPFVTPSNPSPLSNKRKRTHLCSNPTSKQKLTRKASTSKSYSSNNCMKHVLVLKEEYFKEDSSKNDQIHFLGRCTKRRRVLPSPQPPFSSFDLGEDFGGGIAIGDVRLGLLRRPNALTTPHCPGDDVWRLQEQPPALSTPFSCPGDDVWRIQQKQLQQQQSFFGSLQDGKREKTSQQRRQGSELKLHKKSMEVIQAPVLAGRRGLGQQAAASSRRQLPSTTPLPSSPSTSTGRSDVATVSSTDTAEQRVSDGSTTTKANSNNADHENIARLMIGLASAQ